MGGRPGPVPSAWQILCELDLLLREASLYPSADSASSYRKNSGQVLQAGVASADPPAS